MTFCTADRAHVFGDIADGAVELSPLGEVAASEWVRTLGMRPEMLEDVFVVMPNHVHLLFGVLDSASPGGAGGGTAHHRTDTVNRVPTMADLPFPPHERRRFGAPRAKSVSTIVNVYKGAVTRQARRLGLWGDGPLWHARFHDRVVRDEREADRIRRYVADNPARWQRDPYGPLRPPGRRR